MDLKIMEFKATLSNYISKAELPPEVKRMALKEIYGDVAMEANRAISKELRERDIAEGRTEDE